MLFVLFMKWGEIVSMKTSNYIVSRTDGIVFFVKLGDECLGVVFGEHAVQFVVEAGFAGVLGPGGEFLAGDAEFVTEALAVTPFQVGLTFEVVDEGEVGFGVVEPVFVVGVAL